MSAITTAPMSELSRAWWRAHPGARHHALESSLIGAVVMADIRGGAAHVEADHLGEAGRLRGLDRADHAARRSRQDRVLAAEQIGRGEPARGLHEQQARCLL